MTRLGDALCVAHPRSPATGFCRRCGDFACTLCLEYTTKTCSRCVWSRGKGPPRSLPYTLAASFLPLPLGFALLLFNDAYRVFDLSLIFPLLFASGVVLAAWVLAHGVKAMSATSYAAALLAIVLNIAVPAGGAVLYLIADSVARS